MEKLLPLIILFVGAIGGYLIGSHNPEESHHAHDDAHGSHTTHEVRNVEGLAPTVDLVIHEDPKGGYNAQILTTNFRFAPENVSTEDVSGEGHAHIYVDGEKINRVYGEWYHLGNLKDGDRTVSVRLSSNDHFELAVDGEVIADTEIVHAGHDEEDHHDEHGEEEHHDDE